MFIGRQCELKQLENLYNTDKFQFPVIYGRRRVGKTALINKFIADKDAIYFTGVEAHEKQNLENEINRISSKLSNENFVNKAPAQVVEGERAKLEKYRSIYENTANRLHDMLERG